MKKCVLFLFSVSACFMTGAQITWDGGGDGIAWNDPANWFPDAVPAPTDDVVLDNTAVTGNYIVMLPAGAIGISIHSLTITPATATVITLTLPSANTANPGLQITGAGDALVLNSGAVFRNSSGAAMGAGISVTNTFRINNGGRYIHNTGRANASIISQLSTAPGTESGIFEYDVPVASYTPSLSGRTYGSLVLSALANAGSVTYIGGGGMPLTIRGDLQINTGVTLSISMSGAFNIRGNYNQSSSSVFNLQNSTNNNFVRIAGNLSSQGTITKTGTGLPVLELNGTTQQHISVTGTILNNVDFHLSNNAGAILASALLLPYRYTISAGNLTLGNFDLTTPFINQASPPTQTTNHIVTNGSGMLVIPVVTSAIFPVGPDTNHYNPVNIVNGVNAQFAIRVETGINPNMTGVPFPAVINRTWIINASPDPGAGASLRLGFYDGDWLNGFITTTPVDLGKYLSGWNAVRTGLTVAATATDPPYEVAFTNMVSGYNGSFIIGNTAFGLPVNFFVTARAQKRNNAADISWSVSNIAEIHHFEIQRSVNGRDYKTIGIVSAYGNRLEYVYTDNSLLKGMNVYRVKVIHQASASAYSNTVAIMNGENVLMSRIVPNPVYDKATIFLNADAARTVEFILIDMNGRSIKKWKEHIAGGNAVIGINLEKLPAGVYQLIGFAGGVKLDPVRVIKMK
jgi:hypothetical protein